MSLANSVVLVAGATGLIGKKIVGALLDSKKFKEVRVLVRAESLQDEKKKPEVESFKSKGAVVVTGDTSKAETLNFTGVDVVISALSGEQLGQGQLNLIEASKKYKVKRFVPSEFGMDTTTLDTAKYPFVGGKAKIQEAIKGAGLEYTIISTGLFMEFVLQPFIVIDIANKKANIPGTGKEKFAVTHTDDIAKSVPEILTNPKFKNAVVRIAGDHVSFGGVVELIQQTTGAKFDITYEPIDSIRKKVASNPNLFATLIDQLRGILGSGDGEVPANNLNNKDFASVHYRNFVDFWKSQKN